MPAVLNKTIEATATTEAPKEHETGFPMSAAPEIGALLRRRRTQMEVEERRRIEARRREEEAKRRAERPAFGYD